jgi:hypothetical protein
MATKLMSSHPSTTVAIARVPTWRVVFDNRRVLPWPGDDVSRMTNANGSSCLRDGAFADG